MKAMLVSTASSWGGAGVRDEGDRADRALDRVQEGQAGEDAGGHVLPVSYTHLTLPTIYSV